VLEEPFLAREESADLGAVEEALKILAGGPKLALWLTFGNAQRVLKQGLADVSVDAIGIDFYATAATDVPEGFGKLLLAGVLDARSSVIEEPREIAAFVETLRGRGIVEIALVPNGDLQYVSEKVAREKLSRLGKAKTATVEAAA
jgi:5-methyltetrahydropteroyltriglutamate--homocysteine methyltransferase